MSRHLQDSGAEIVGCYRYLLWREYVTEGPHETMLFVMLNPSTADASKDDPTIRRCVGFALDRGYNRIEVANLFALRATDPRELKRHPLPVGPENNAHITHAARKAGMVVCAWGNHGSLQARGMTVRRMLNSAGIDLFCFGVSKTGQPLHPLYLRADSELRIWSAGLR